MINQVAIYFTDIEKKSKYTSTRILISVCDELDICFNLETCAVIYYFYSPQQITNNMEADILLLLWIKTSTYQGAALTRIGLLQSHNSREYRCSFSTWVWKVYVWLLDATGSLSININFADEGSDYRNEFYAK